MKVYIVTAEDQFESTHILNAYDSEYKAKVFCKKEYGIDTEDWTKNEITDSYLYYDNEHFYVMSDDKYDNPYYRHFMLSNFEIHIREVE